VVIDRTRFHERTRDRIALKVLTVNKDYKLYLV
jgi:hypothetical protein